MIDKIKRLFKKRKEGFLKHVGTVAGHKIHAITRIEPMAARRYLSYVKISEEHDLGVSKQDLEVFLELIEEAKGNRERIGAVLETLRGYLSLYTDTRRIFEIANCFILVDDEPIERFSEEHTLLKKQLFDSSEQCRFFFIQSTMEYLKLSTYFKTDGEVESYLQSQEVKVLEQMYLKLTQKNT